jgi:hypothetical protein
MFEADVQGVGRLSENREFVRPPTDNHSARRIVS